MTTPLLSIISVSIWNNCEVSVVEKVAEFKDLDGAMREENKRLTI